MAEGNVTPTTHQVRRQLKRQGKKLLRFIGMTKYKVCYMRDGREEKSPWFLQESHAKKAMDAMVAKYGGPAIILVD